GRAVPDPGRDAALGTAHALSLRAAPHRATPDCGLAHRARSTGAAPPGGDPVLALGALRRPVRLGRFQLLPGRQGQRRLAPGQDPGTDSPAGGRPYLARRAPASPAPSKGRWSVTAVHARAR